MDYLITGCFTLLLNAVTQMTTEFKIFLNHDLHPCLKNNHVFLKTNYTYFFKQLVFVIGIKSRSVFTYYVIKHFHENADSQISALVHRSTQVFGRITFTMPKATHYDNVGSMVHPILNLNMNLLHYCFMFVHICNVYTQSVIITALPKSADNIKCAITDLVLACIISY